MTVANAKIFKFQALKLIDYNSYEILERIQAAGSAVFNFSPELAEQMSGPSLYPIETEVSTISTEATLNIGEYGSRILEVLMGAKSTDQAVADGLVTTPINVKGELVKASSGKALTGLTLATDKSKIKAGFFRLKLKDKTAKTVEVIAYSSPNLTPSEYEDFGSSIVKTVTLVNAGSLDLGIGVTGTAAATVDLSAMEDGDSTTFRVFRPGSEAYVADLGQAGQRIPKTKILCLGRTMSDGRWFEFFAENCIFPGLNFNFADEFSANEVTGKMIFDGPTQRVAQVATWAP